MKYVWEEKDAVCGRIVCREPMSPVMNGNQAKHTYKIGWHTGDHVPMPWKEPGSDRYHTDHFCLIAMTDGMVSSPISKKDLVKRLNEEQMIPATHKFVINVMDYLRDCYNSEV